MERFGRYVLLEKLAAGGMGEVYRAAAVGSAGFARPIAIKRILPHLAEEADFVTMLVDEAKLSATLMHPNIVQVLDLGKQDGLYFIAMDFVAGQPLNRVLANAIRNKQPIPVEVATHMVHQALMGLAHAHEKRDALGRPVGIIHRDISPQNILVGFDGTVRLADFGIAKAAERSTQTATGTLKGKPGYVAPEQVLGKEVDQRLDIYAMGAVLYETLSLRRFRKGENDMHVLMLAASGEYQPLQEMGLDLPQELCAIVDRALTKDPAERWQTAREFGDALHAFRRAQGWDMQQVSVSALMLALFPTEVERERQADIRFGELIAQLSLAGEDEISGILEQLTRKPASGTGFETPVSVRKADAVLSGNATPVRKSGGGNNTVLGVGAAVAVVLLGAGGWWFLRPGASAAGLPDPQPIEMTPPAGATSTAAAVASGILVVETVPPGAQVRVAGELLPSPSPVVARDVAAGPQDVELTLPGYAKERRVVEVPAGGRQALKVTLVRLAREVPLVTDPPGATVYLDGKVVGTTPMTLKLDGGPHKLRVEVPGRKAEERALDGDAPPPQLSVALPPAPAPAQDKGRKAPPRKNTPQDKPSDDEPAATGPGTLDITSQPWGRVYVDGKDTGRFTPVVGLEVPAGPHTVKLVNPELGVSAEAKVNVKPGATVTVSRELK